MATKSDGPRPEGETIVTVGPDLRQHPGRPASGRPSPVGATDIRQAVSTPADIGYAGIGYANPARPRPEGARLP